MASNILEYVFLVLNIIYALRLAWEIKKNLKADSRYKEYVENQNSVLVYKKNNEGDIAVRRTSQQEMSISENH
jgi:hypothetical protein